jgi:hypothetical protein
MHSLGLIVSGSNWATYGRAYILRAIDFSCLTPAALPPFVAVALYWGLVTTASIQANCTCSQTWSDVQSSQNPVNQQNATFLLW